MTAIWLLSSRGRQKDAQAVIDACQKAGMTSQGVVYADETPYKLRLPSNWAYHHEPEWLSLQGSMQWCYENYPDASQYGWLADDTRPRTPGWDQRLEAAAGNWRLAYANDQWFSEDPIELSKLEAGHNLSSGLCWGGELVRTVGWWALPGVRQAGIDTAWCDIIKPFALQRYVDDVVVEHLNWRTGKRKKDSGDDWTREGTEYIEADFVTKNRWAWEGGLKACLERVHAATGRPNTLRYQHQIEQLRVDALFAVQGGITPSELQRLDELQRLIDREEQLAQV